MTSRRLTVLIGALALLTPVAPVAAEPIAGGSDIRVEQTGGGTILFDQLTTQAQVAVGMPAQRFDPPLPTDAEGADDFEVTDADGWTIGELVFGTPGFGLIRNRGSVDVRVYPDDAGGPGGPAACSYDGITGQQHGTEQLRVPLPTPCVLDPGRYWLSLQNTNGRVLWALGSPNPLPPPFVLGARAHWRNPADGWGTGCTDWSEISTCLVDGVPVAGGFDTQALFQVCGAVGTDVEDFAGCGNEEAAHDLSVTLAVDDGDPAQCGAATTLTVEMGDRVNVCYTLTNTGTATLGFHWLRDDVEIRPLTDDETVAPGETIQFNRLITATRSRTIAAEAQATDVLPWYHAVQEDFEFLDITGTGTPLDLDDDGSANVTMPFRFNLFGIRSDQVCVNNNGFLLFDWDRPCDGFHQDLSIPNESVPIKAGQIAPYWDDLFTGGNVYYDVLGEAPNRRFVVQWDEKNHYNDGASDPGTVTFEAILDETTDAVSFQYLDTTFDNPQHPEWDRGGNATVGFQSLVRDGFGGPWRSEPFHDPVLEPESGRTWTSMGYFQATANASATLNVPAPAITVAPDALTATTVPGAGVSVPLTIGNTGDRELAWQVGETPDAGVSLTSGSTLTARSGRLSRAEVDSLGVPRWQKPVRVDVNADAEPQAVSSLATRAYAPRFEFLTPPFGPRYQRINDVADPADTTEIASLIGRDVFAGEFIDNDFSRQYLIDECCRQLFTIDTETGETTINRGQIQGSPQVVVWRGLAWDATTDTLFAVGTDTFGALPDTRFFLARLDLEQHEVVATTVGELPGLAQLTSPVDIAVDAAGRMFALDLQGNRLLRVNKRTAAAVPIGPLGFNATGALGVDFDDAAGTLYLASLDAKSQIGSLYTVNTLTGRATVVDQMGDGSQHTALAVASGAPCVPPTEVPWVRLSPSEGTTISGDSDEVTVFLNAANLSVGIHESSVCVGSNDPHQPVLSVPVRLTVVEPGGDITMQARGRRVDGVHTVDLSWEGATSTDVDVYRNGEMITTVPNDGAHVDTTGRRGAATYTYLVCEAGTTNCARPVRVRFRAPLVVAVNTGGGRFVDGSGVVWLADRSYRPGDWGRTGTSRRDTTQRAISGTVADRLFKDRRLGTFGYRFDGAPAGRYDIVLRFAELDPKVRVGKRTFSVFVNGRRVIASHDVARHVGRFKADHHAVTVRNTGGPLRVRLTASPGSLKPMLNALRIRQRF